MTDIYHKTDRRPSVHYWCVGRGRVACHTPFSWYPFWPDLTPGASEHKALVTCPDCLRLLAGGDPDRPPQPTTTHA